VDADRSTAAGLVALGLPVVGPPGAAEPLVVEIDVAGRAVSLHLVDAGLACCSLEVMAALLGRARTRDAGALVTSDAPAEVLVVSGTCTDVMAPMLRRLYEDLGAPRVVSFGACTASGGPYWDSYSVTPGIDSVIPVDVVVPGCPPPPEALLAGLEQLVGEP
jgi:NADH-quinone oxidoreductase subunit B